MTLDPTTKKIILPVRMRMKHSTNTASTFDSADAAAPVDNQEEEDDDDDDKNEMSREKKKKKKNKEEKIKTGEGVSTDTLLLQLEITHDASSGTLRLAIFSPYWVHNASGLPLMFRHHHLSSYENRESRPIIAGQFGGDVLSTESKGMSDETGAETRTGTRTGMSTTLLGAGPRKMGLRELLPGPQGEGRQGLREARSVSTLLVRKEMMRRKERQQHHHHHHASRKQHSARRSGRSLNGGGGGNGDNGSQQQQQQHRLAQSTAAFDLDAFLRGAHSDEDSSSGGGEDVLSMRPEDLLLVGHTDELNRTGRLSARLARGVDSDHATATFHTLLPTGWSTPFGLDSAGTTGEVEIREDGEKNKKNMSTLSGGSGVAAAYSLGVSIGVAAPPFSRTKVISLMPRFVVVNLVGRSLLVKQEGALGGDRYVGGPGTFLFLNLCFSF